MFTVKAPTYDEPAREDLSRLLGAARRGEALGSELCRSLGLDALRCVQERRAGRAVSQAEIHRHMEALANNIPLRRTLEHAALALRAAGVQAIVYKGQDYLERIYGDAGARCMADIDLLVPRAQLASAERALLEAGYIADISCRRQHERKFCRNGVAIDLHHALVEDGRMAVDHGGVFARALPCAYVPGLWVLEATDACLVHCINQTVKGFDLPAHSYLELQALFDGADRAALCRRARDWQALSSVYTSLRVLGELGHAGAARLSRALPLARARRQLLDATVARFALRTIAKPEARRATLLAIKTTLIDDPVDAALFVPRWLKWALPTKAPRPLVCGPPPRPRPHALN